MMNSETPDLGEEAARLRALADISISAQSAAVLIAVAAAFDERARMLEAEDERGGQSHTPQRTLAEGRRLLGRRHLGLLH